ncbi:hypothetical protein ACWGJ2_33070 [Streptomyces sp. NPDC054796]
MIRYLIRHAMLKGSGCGVKGRRRIFSPVFAGLFNCGSTGVDLAEAGSDASFVAAEFLRQFGRLGALRPAFGQVLVVFGTPRLVGVGVKPPLLLLLGIRRPLPELRKVCRAVLASTTDPVKPPMPRQVEFEQETLFGDAWRDTRPAGGGRRQPERAAPVCGARVVCPCTGYCSIRQSARPRNGHHGRHPPGGGSFARWGTPQQREGVPMGPSFVIERLEPQRGGVWRVRFFKGLVTFLVGHSKPAKSTAIETLLYPLRLTTATIMPEVRSCEHIRLVFRVAGTR